MAISSGGISSDAPIPDDLVAIYQGGTYFLERMKAFEAAKASAQAALTQLQLGNDIIGAYSDAQAKQAAAAQALTEAQTHLDSAKTQAATTLDSAQKQAQVLVDTATKRANDLIAAASSTKSDADAYAAKVKADADAMTAKANALMQDVTTQTAAAQAQAQAAAAAQAAADQAKAQADTVRLTYEQKMAQLKAIAAS